MGDCIGMFTSEIVDQPAKHDTIRLLIGAAFGRFLFLGSLPFLEPSLHPFRHPAFPDGGQETLLVVREPIPIYCFLHWLGWSAIVMVI
jgi:hypothetical protein